MLDIYTDGGCIGNPGPGGYAFVATSGGTLLLTERWATPFTTNNEMELTAIYRALSWANETWPGHAVTIHTDSQYAMCCIESWYPKWKTERTLHKKKNIPLIEAIIAIKPRALSFHWVRGHNGNKFNEMADSLAGQAINELSRAFC